MPQVGAILIPHPYDAGSLRHGRMRIDDVQHIFMRNVVRRAIDLSIFCYAQQIVIPANA
jgi:hypothetical protein